MTKPSRYRRSFLEGMQDTASQIRAGVKRAVGAEDHIRLAVTGLSRAGKTVFITSMVQNLLALGQGMNTLPKLERRLTENGQCRLTSVQVLPAGAGFLPRFEQEANFFALAADTPAWPSRTDDVATLSLMLEIVPRSIVGRRLGSHRVRLDILDYPGEWLLDLPMVEQSFAEWSAATLALLRTPPRDACAAPFMQFMTALRPTDLADENVARKGHALYRDALHACRERHGLRYLQPGRFLCLGPRSEAPFLWFFPLEGAEDTDRPDTLGALLRDRFEAYCDDMRVNFFDSLFTEFNRQVMLVDVLGALCAGREAFEDTARAILEIAASLRYGENTFTGRMGDLAAQALHAGKQMLLLGASGDEPAKTGPRIERVAVVATKADHVPEIKRDNLRNLLRHLAQPVASSAVGAGVSYHVASSLRAASDGTAKIGDHHVPVVQGIKLGESVVRSCYVGEVPSGAPPESFWGQPYFEMPVFTPPRIDATGRSGIPHLHMDDILDELIGGLL